MMSRLRLAETPFLAATLAIVLTLALPWAFGGPAQEGNQVAEVSAIRHWTGDGVQLASEAHATPKGVTRQ